MRPLPQLWLSALRAPASFAFAHSELALVPHDDIAKLGAVTKPETLNYRTLMPEAGGLFSIEAFGEGDAFPDREHLRRTDPWEHVRATTFGRIDLPVAMIHPLALRHCADDVAERFGFDVHATIESGDETAWSAFHARLEDPIVTPLLVQSLLVLPPYLRPMLPLEGGRWATSGVIDLYRRVINRANRLARLGALNAPEQVTNNETRMLYDAVDSLCANELRDNTITGPNGHALVSLWGFAGDDRFDALAEHEHHAPLTRRRQTQLAAIRAMGLELRPRSGAISSGVTTLGVPL